MYSNRVMKSLIGHYCDLELKNSKRYKGWLVKSKGLDIKGIEYKYCLLLQDHNILNVARDYIKTISVDGVIIGRRKKVVKNE